MANFDFKKEYKDLYVPARKPHLIEVPAMKFIAIKGKGNPNIEGGDYMNAVPILYALSFTIKMSEKSGNHIEGYIPYVVPPLEGLWWSDYDDFDTTNVIEEKDKLSFWSMIRQPDFVNEEVFAWACESVAKKKGLDVSKAKFLTFEEGLCVQMLHIGSYDDEPASFAQMNEFVEAQGLVYENHNIPDGIEAGVHHEIYLGDPRKSQPEKLKTVLRKQVKRG